MALSIIVAANSDLAIGKDGKIPWHISEDLKYFKQVTSGHCVIMGRKTFESIGGPLKGRKNIIISRSVINLPEYVYQFNDLRFAIKFAQSIDSEPFIIGGSAIYKQSIRLADKIYFSLVNCPVKDADCFFPELDMNEWQEESVTEGENGMVRYFIYTRTKDEYCEDSGNNTKPKV